MINALQLMKNVFKSLVKVVLVPLGLTSTASVTDEAIGFIDFMMKSKRLLEYTNLFFPNEYEMNDKIILNFLFNRF